MSADLDSSRLGPSEDPSQRSLFDRHASTYSEDLNCAVSFGFKNSDFFTKAKADLLIHLIGKRFGNVNGLNFLDVGCGTGILHPLLIAAGLNVSGVDVVSGPLEVARATNPEVQYRIYDGRRLPFEDKMFDVTLAVCVFHHVPAKEQTALAAEMRRVTRPGGLLCIIEHNPLNLLTRLAVRRCPFDKDAALLPARKTLALLQAVGMSAGTIKIRYFLFSPFDFACLRVAERFIGWLCLGAQYCAYGINSDT